MNTKKAKILLVTSLMLLSGCGNESEKYMKHVSSSVNTCCATAVLEISNYYGQDLEFEIYDMGGFHTEGLEENVSTVLNSVFQSGMTGFDLMLSEMGMSLSDIGFTAYLD